jgi:hypothetical protein
MADVGPILVTAHNAAQAEYLVRSRADQRHVTVQGVRVEDAGSDGWYVTVTVDDADADKLGEAHLEEDTQVLHFRRTGR